MSKYRLLIKKYKVHVKPGWQPQVFADRHISVSEAEDIAAWVISNELGKRVAFDMWKLNDANCVTLFRLKWS